VLVALLRGVPRCAALAAATVLVAPAAAPAAPDRSAVITPATGFAWNGPSAVGHNTAYRGSTGEPCGKTAETYCDETLVEVVPGDFYAGSAGGAAFSLDGFDVPDSDIDLYVYRSDAAGTVGELLDASLGPGGASEEVSVPGAAGFYLVRAIYYDVEPASGYRGRAEMFGRPLVAPDVDDPRGLQDSLASDPGLGFRSQSEPHIAQSPVDPDVLVAASKRYNRDRDSLAEYEFKIGTYVSFDRGRRWHDLGQVAVCPPAQAPPASWPGNTCYPDEDPARGGTGPEDAADDRGTGDVGEEYVTSDPWVDFDDEGNALLMVLDSPPFPSGAGWGMSMHRWETPTLADVRAGLTWSAKIPINAYETAAEQRDTLDDKNTFAVNRAGPDGDGRPGTAVACWGQNYASSPGAGTNAQRIVCERSADGGRTWPGRPVVLSSAEQLLVIGVHVVADTLDPETFYAVWLEYLSGALDGTGRNTLYVSRTRDGGRTWSLGSPIVRFRPLPRRFPRQAFRNLSLPILAVGPRGELNLVYADYGPLRAPTRDADGLQADIRLVRSLDGGLSWSAPQRVNQDETNADQFQPYIRVTPRGQLAVSFFDRRLDRPDGGAHEGNVFIDTFLARSNDGGASWAETRVSHDAWDPGVNPPISPSGEFIGDYQGLVADDCAATPFVNDTHLANPPGRDPLFDGGDPRSPFQQVFSWTVPNTPPYGGTSVDCEAPVATRARVRATARGRRAARAARSAQASARALRAVPRGRALRVAARHRVVTAP
jgi:hypothetical protein